MTRLMVLALSAALLPGIAQADPWDELQAQRRNFGLGPLIKDPYLMKLAQAKAEYQAAHHINLKNGYNGHEGPPCPPGYTEGTGQLMPEWGWFSCCTTTIPTVRAGCGMALGSDGRRYMVMYVQGSNHREVPTMSRNAIDTSHMTPNPIRIPFKGLTVKRGRPPASGSISTGRQRGAVCPRCGRVHR